MIIKAGICGDTFADREINISYNLSMMTQIDEITKNRHMQMSLIEFYEALARLSEAYSPYPIGCENEPDIWTLEKRENLPLYVKLESFINLLYNRLIDSTAKDYFIIP